MTYWNIDTPVMFMDRRFPEDSSIFYEKISYMRSTAVAPVPGELYRYVVTFLKMKVPRYYTRPLPAAAPQPEACS